MPSKGATAAVSVSACAAGFALGYYAAQYVAAQGKGDNSNAPRQASAPASKSRASPSATAAAISTDSPHRHWVRSRSAPNDAAAAAEPQPETKTPEERKVAWEAIRARLPRQKNKEEKKRRKELFERFDKDKSGSLTFEEVYNACVNELHLDEFTSRLRDITKRAFNKAKGLGTADPRNLGDAGEVEFLEFRKMLCFIYDYFELTVMFDTIDEDGNGLLELEELKRAVPLIKKWGLEITDPEATFYSIDTNRSGKITFDEFIGWATEKRLDVDGDPDNVS